MTREVIENSNLVIRPHGCGCEWHRPEAAKDNGVTVVNACWRTSSA